MLCLPRISLLLLLPFLPTSCKGALLCLAAAAVGLGEPSEAYLRQIVPPVLASFTDQDSRVRYYACEALYNIAKVRAQRCAEVELLDAPASLVAVVQGL
jgi:hypothetical protein